MNDSQHRFFVALLPPQFIQDEVNQIKQYFSDRYHSKKAFNSPPHVTLQPPFQWSEENVPVLETCLRDFAAGYSPIPVTLDGFGAFKPKVIYVNVVKTPELLRLQTDLLAHLEASLGIVDPVAKTRPFSPHMTVAFRDLTRQNFKAAWPEFEHRPLHFQFTASNLTLLIHDGRQWNVSVEFSFQITSD